MHSLSGSPIWVVRHLPSLKQKVLRKTRLYVTDPRRSDLFLGSQPRQLHVLTNEPIRAALALTQAALRRVKVCSNKLAGGQPHAR